MLQGSPPLLGKVAGCGPPKKDIKGKEVQKGFLWLVSVTYLSWKAMSFDV